MTSEHFLIGSPITYPDVTDVKMNRSISPGNALTVLKIMAMQLSASSPTTNQMEKYGSETFGVSTMVVVKEENLPLLRRKLDRIMEMYSVYYLYNIKKLNRFPIYFILI